MCDRGERLERTRPCTGLFLVLTLKQGRPPTSEGYYQQGQIRTSPGASPRLLALRYSHTLLLVHHLIFILSLSSAFAP